MFDATKPGGALEGLNRLVKEFLDGPANHSSMPEEGETVLGPALTGVAAGHDPIWLEFKEAVHPDHWTPREAFQLAFPQAGPVEPSELSVFSWVLPQTERTRRDQRRARDFPAERWVRTRFLGQPLVNDALAVFLVENLARAGVLAVSPDQLPAFGRRESERFLIASTWSQRHAAFAAGLGSFGLCDGLITAVGKAMRCGSVLVRLELPATPRPYSHYREYCLYYNSPGTCGLCIPRCPAGAISPRGHDKKLCRPYTEFQSRDYVRAQWPELDGAYGCGLCQVAVPCEKGIPPRPEKKPGLKREESA
ncbi:MAG: epoxyqueuosine reductase [Candidatus Adiutrix sp.]|jgi:ferredoxin|nr:epoxyqueuosine reductase [Candidatus Adiutrix sp.]